MRPRSLIALGALVFAFTALFHVPAERLLAWAGPWLAQGGVALHGAEGTLSAGRVVQVDRQNRVLVRDLAWTLQKLQLLIGRASFRLAGGRDGTLIDGTAFLLPSGTLGLRDLNATMPAKDLLGAAGFPALPVEGQAGLDLAALDLRDGWPDKAQGTLTLRGLGWKLGREPVVLGDYEALIDHDTAGIKVTLRTVRGALEASGEARAGHDRSWEVNLQLRPRTDAPPLVPNLVRNLGQPDAQGWTHLRRRGQLGTPGTVPPA